MRKEEILKIEESIMKSLSSKEIVDALVEVNLKNVMIGDRVFVENDLDGVEYTILDLGDPFILIENEVTRFAYLHRVNKLYKKIKKVKND